MQKIFFLLIIGLLTSMVTGQINDWENPEIFEINKEAPHSTLIPYENENISNSKKINCYSN